MKPKKLFIALAHTFPSYLVLWYVKTGLESKRTTSREKLLNIADFQLILEHQSYHFGQIFEKWRIVQKFITLHIIKGMSSHKMIWKAREKLFGKVREVSYCCPFQNIEFDLFEEKIES